LPSFSFLRNFRDTELNFQFLISNFYKTNS
jgi:hypothetical protein